MIQHQQPTAADPASLVVTAAFDGANWNTTGTLLDAGGQEIQIQEFITDWPLDGDYLTAVFGVRSLQMVGASRPDEPDRVRYLVTPRRQQPAASAPETTAAAGEGEATGYNGTPTWRGGDVYHFPNEAGTDRREH